MEKHSKKEKKSNLLLILLQIIFVAIFIYSGYHIINWYKENKENNEILNQMSKAVKIEKDEEGNESYKVDFEQLKQTNEDIVGWIKVNNTKVEYPVVQGKDNSYYLTHSIEKKYNAGGSIFVDSQNKLDGTERNVVIYGHNRRDGSMFGTLKNVLNKEWYDNEENKYITIVAPDGEIQYEIFSIYQIEKEDYYIKKNFTDAEFKQFVDTIKSRSVKDFNTDVDENSKVLTLSTCANDNKYRVVIHAKEI